MSSEPLPSGPDPEAITRYILETWPETDMVGIEGANFFSLDAEKHSPNFAAIVWSDDFDQASNLSRAGVFHLNIGVSGTTFERLVASGRRDAAPRRGARSARGRAGPAPRVIDSLTLA